MPKTPIDKLDAALSKILSKYAEGVTKDVKELSRDFAKKGAQAVKQSAQGLFGGTGAYAKSWTSQYEEGRLSAQGIIYSRIPGLPHLLENGHAKRGGGRVPGRTHIAPVKEKLVEEFERAVRETV